MSLGMWHDEWGCCLKGILLLVSWLHETSTQSFWGSVTLLLGSSSRDMWPCMRKRNGTAWLP